MELLLTFLSTAEAATSLGHIVSRKRIHFFVWNAHLVACEAFESEYDILKQLFCTSAGPSYTQSNMNFTAGCFAAFTPSCTQLQWTSFEGFDAGAGGVSTWDFSAPAPHTHKTKEPKNINPVCSIKGLSASTIPGKPFPVHRYQHTTFNITYHHDTYKSRATYDNAGTSCHVEWEGNFTISRRSEAYPDVMLYSYSSFSTQTKTASTGPCASYTLDPASCTYLSGDSQDRHDCFIVWDGFVDDPPCTYFRLFAHESISSDASGPTFQVLSRKDDSSADDEGQPIGGLNPEFDRSSASLISLSFGAVLSFVVLLVLQ